MIPSAPSSRRSRFDRRGASLRTPLCLGFALLSAAALPASSRAASPSNGDALYWNGGTAETDWDSPNNVWADFGTGAQAQAVSVYQNENNLLGFFFTGATYYSTTAPTAMTIGTTQLYTNYISFVDGFNATNTLTIGGGRNGYTTLECANNTNINDHASSGTITFNPGSGNNGGALYFNLEGALGVSPAAGSNVVINSTISHATTAGGSVYKSDAGTLTLNGASNDYTGGTTVAGGTLVVLSTTGTGAVTVGSSTTVASVNAGVLLTGTGQTFGGTTVNIGATISPGTLTNKVGTLTLYSGSLTAPAGLTLNGIYQVDISKAGADLLNVASGALVLNSDSSVLSFGSIDRSQLKVNTQYLIAEDTSGTGALAGTFSNAKLTGSTITDAYGDVFQVNYATNQITLVVESLGATPVPEPATWFASTLVALLGAGVCVRRHRRNAAQ